MPFPPGGYYWDYSSGTTTYFSNHWNSFKDLVPVHQIYKYHIFKWVKSHFTKCMGIIFEAQVMATRVTCSIIEMYWHYLIWILFTHVIFKHEEPSAEIETLTKMPQRVAQILNTESNMMHTIAHGQKMLNFPRFTDFSPDTRDCGYDFVNVLRVFVGRYDAIVAGILDLSTLMVGHDSRHSVPD